MSTRLEELADVLEKTAVYLDAMEHEKAEEIRQNREKLAEILKDQYEDITGDTISDGVLKKIADSDVDVLSAIERLTTKTASAEDLGAPADRSDNSSPATPKEAAAAADEHFETWAMSE